MKNNPIEKAKNRAYQAQMILVENGNLDEEINRYDNPKYIRKSGRALWRAVLIALDTVFDIRVDRRTKFYIEDYLDTIVKKDERLSKIVDMAYSVIYVYMAFDGIQYKLICDEGFRLANNIIDRCEEMLQ